MNSTEPHSNNPELLTMLVILVAILPIPAIAFFHHFFIGRVIPAIPGEGTINIKGFVPGFISWWESLYSWLVFVLSTLIAILLSTPFLPLFKLNYETIIDSTPHKNIQAIFAIFWIVSAAIFYQIEYSFKSHLMFEATNSPSYSLLSWSVSASSGSSVPSDLVSSRISCMARIVSSTRFFCAFRDDRSCRRLVRLNFVSSQGLPRVHLGPRCRPIDSTYLGRRIILIGGGHRLLGPSFVRTLSPDCRGWSPCASFLVQKI